MTVPLRRFSSILLLVVLLLCAAAALPASAADQTGAVQDPTSPPGCSTPPIPSTCPGPIVTGFFPSNGSQAGGTLVTFLGSHFSRCGGVQAVLVDGIVTTEFTVQSDAQLQVITPAHDPGFASVVVQTRCGTSYPVLFTYT